MAFIGILLASFVFIILLALLLGMVMFGICFIVFAILSRKNKTKKSMKILKIVFGVLTIICFIPLLLAFIFLSSKQKETIEYNGKKYSVEQETINEFYSEISNGNIEEIDNYLSKNPELINSKNLEGLLPLGYAIKFKKLDCIKYFVEKGADINSITSESKTGTLEYMFHYNYYDDEILEYILKQDNLDVNKCRSAMSVAQFYIKSIIKDKEISEKELELFQELLDKGLDLSLTNGTDTNTYDYVYCNVSDEVINVNKIREMVNSRK